MCPRFAAIRRLNLADSSEVVFPLRKAFTAGYMKYGAGVIFLIELPIAECCVEDEVHQFVAYFVAKFVLHIGKHEGTGELAVG